MTYPVILLEMKEGYSKSKCKMMRNKNCYNFIPLRGKQTGKNIWCCMELK